MSFKDRWLLKGLRKRLQPKDVALIKLVLWCVIVVWMALFAVHTVVTAQLLAKWAPGVFPEGNWYQMLAKSIPAWYVFTISLVIYFVMRWADRKLRKGALKTRKEEKEKEID